MPYFICLIGGYLVGSFPTAYLVIKRAAGIDIREAGSGNVGGFNAFTVTQSKKMGWLVGVIDGVKGLIAAGIASKIFEGSFWMVAVALFGAILGHNYPVWLRFKGGRGLATACGGLFVIGVGYVIIWCTLWTLLFRLRKDILLSNIVSIVSTPALLYAVPDSFVQALMVSGADLHSYRSFSVALSFVLLIGHFDVIKDWSSRGKV